MTSDQKGPCVYRTGPDVALCVLFSHCPILVCKPAPGRCVPHAEGPYLKCAAAHCGNMVTCGSLVAAPYPKHNWPLPPLQHVCNSITVLLIPATTSVSTIQLWAPWSLWFIFGSPWLGLTQWLTNKTSTSLKGLLYSQPRASVHNFYIVILTLLVNTQCDKLLGKSEPPRAYIFMGEMYFRRFVPHTYPVWSENIWGISQV